MKKKYEVRWYEHNLTQWMSRKFFTEWGAVVFASYIEAYECAKPKIHKL